MGTEYKGDDKKTISSKYLYNTLQNLITLLKSKFVWENKEIVDKLNVNSNNKLTYNGQEVASSSVSISTKEGNTIILESDGLYSPETDLSNYSTTEYIENNYTKTEDLEKDYMKLEDYSDRESKEILGNKIKKDSLSYLNLSDVGELDGVTLEDKLIEHISNKRIHEIVNSNSLIIENEEWGKGDFTNFVIENDGQLGLRHYSENPTTYVLDTAIFISKIYDVEEETQFMSIEIDITRHPYLSEYEIFIRYGTTPVYERNQWCDWLDVTDNETLTGVNTRYIQVKVEAKTHDRTKNIKIDFIRLFYGMDENLEIINARYRKADLTTYRNLGERIDATDASIGKLIDDEHIDNKHTWSSECVQNKINEQNSATVIARW